jgi:hypothetical protein
MESSTMKNPNELSSAPKTFGVLSIVFSSIVLLYSLPTTFMLIVPFVASKAEGLIPKGNAPLQAEAMISSIKMVYGGIGLIGLLLAIMSGLLLTVGIGQLRYRRWAQKFSVYWGWAALASIAGLVVLSVCVIGPGYSHLFDATGAAQGAQAMPLGGMLGKMFGGIYAVMFVMFYAPYPILLIACFTRDRVRSAMIR